MIFAVSERRSFTTRPVQLSMRCHISILSEKKQNMKMKGQEIPEVSAGEVMKTETLIRRLQCRHLLNNSNTGVLVEDEDEKALEISWNMNTILCGRNKYQQTWSGFCCHGRWVLFIFSISSPPDIPGTNHLRLSSAPIASFLTFSALSLSIIPFFFKTIFLQSVQLVTIFTISAAFCRLNSMAPKQCINNTTLWHFCH